MHQSLLPFNDGQPVVAIATESKGVVYTRSWVVELLLDLAGYTAEMNLVDSLAVEPSAGEGAFLVPMVQRLVASCRRQNRPFLDCASSLIAYELNDASAISARRVIESFLENEGIHPNDAVELASGWIHSGDYLHENSRLPGADYIVGNPPYIRLEEIPIETARHYRDLYPTMRGRADLYVAFFEAALRQLRPGGVCGYICADRWMLNQYGANLRQLVTARFGVEFVVEMHNAQAFHEDVSAYPAITVIRRGSQASAVVASISTGIGLTDGNLLARSLRSATFVEPGLVPEGLTQAVVDRWFTGSDPWPCHPPRRLVLLRQLEDRFGPLESKATGTKVGIGVATGLDQVYITKAAAAVEEARLLPLALAQDTVTGQFTWSGHRLVNPWDDAGLVRLDDFPRLRAYFDQHEDPLRKRNVASRNPQNWYRTIDRVNLALTRQPKLYIPDIKDRLNPVLDRGETYPHHNLYFIVSDLWDLEVLGGLLMSAIGQLFVEAYGVRMRGGYLRFQAQYLRRIRVPQPEEISPEQARQLVAAFRTRDRDLASGTAREVYQVDALDLEGIHGY